jgi:hypothetical protein
MAKQLQAASQHRFVRRIVGADTADIFVHNLLEALKSVHRQEITGRNGSRHDLIAADGIGLERLEYGLLEICVLRLADLGRPPAQIVHIVDRSLGRDATLRKRSRREFVGCAANGIACTEKSLDRHHPVVTPLIFCGSIVRRSARPRAGASRVRPHDVRF